MNTLIVEDCEYMLQLLAQIVGQVKDINIVGTTSSGYDCINKIEELKPDLVFLDIGLPDISGLEVAKYINQNHPNIIMIFVTGHNEYGVDAYQLNVMDYLTKPFEDSRVFTAYI